MPGERMPDPDAAGEVRVTGTDAQLHCFHLDTLLFTRAVRREGQTVYYAVDAADLRAVRGWAREWGLAVEWRPPGEAGGESPWRTDADECR